MAPYGWVTVAVVAQRSSYLSSYGRPGLWLYNGYAVHPSSSITAHTLVRIGHLCLPIYF